MKKIFTTSLFILLYSITLKSFSPGTNDESMVVEENSTIKNNAVNPCITPSQYEIIERRCAQNTRILNNGIQQRLSLIPTQLSWPLKPVVGFTDYSYYYISAYVDQNPAAGSFSDFNCGTTSYDGHRGTDISIFPFGFYKMDNSLVEVIAASAGTIIDKSDGNFDRNCSANNLPSNYVIIQHADGSHALYWHLKKNSVTSKGIGQMVANGEYLGAVGSSGSSSGPHLHFEIWSGNTNQTYIDPFFSTCNNINNSTWWFNQKPHTEPAVVKVSVNTTDIVLPGCPTTETLNESDIFPIPFQGAGLPAGKAKFYIYIRNETDGMTANCKIQNPNGSTFSSWNHISNSNNKNIIRGWTKSLPSTPGMYTFEVTYNSIVCSKSFEVSTTATYLTEYSSLSSEFIVYPNPNNGKIIVEYNPGKNKEQYHLRGNGEIEFYNILGEKVFQTPISENKTQFDLDIRDGVYFYNIKNHNLVITTGKLIVK